MAQLEHVSVPAMDPRRFESVLEPDDYQALLQLIDESYPNICCRKELTVSS